MAKLSVIVPVYNVEKYIERCLKSLVNQTLKDIEIIIVNDESTDRSTDIVEKYIKSNSSKFKYLEKKNGGLSSARNYGLEYATGEYIAFLDSDDYIELNMYEEMYKLAKKDDADIVECDFIWEWDYGKKVFDKRRNYNSKSIKDNKIKTGKLKKSQTSENLITVEQDKNNENNKKEMMKRPRVVAWNKIYKRELINKTKTRFPEGLIYEDLEFFYKLLPYVNKISYINQYFVHYVQREDSISNSQTEKTGDIFKILDNIFSFYKENNIYDKYEKELKSMSRRIMFGSSLKRIMKIKDTKIKRKMILKTVFYFLKFSRWVNYKCENIKKVDLTYMQIFSKKEDKYSFEKKQREKICFGITKLGIGGAERVLVDIANELCNDYNITIFTIYGEGELEKELDSKIKTVSIFKREMNNKIIPIYVLICGKFIYNRFLRHKFNIDIAFLEGPITRIFSYKGNNKKIAWVHNDISKVFGKDKKAEIKQYIDKWFYKKYDQIVLVSEQNKKAFENVYGNISKRKVIYNYINKDRVLRLAGENIRENENLKVYRSNDKEKINQEKKLYRFEISKIDEIMKKDNDFEKNFVVVSRLVKQKAIDRLIRVHRKLIDEGLKHKIFVIGDGEEKENLLNLAEKLDVKDSFIFLGQIKNPYPYIKKADFFALLSYFEGYGMVLEEAKILNKNILVTNTAAVEAVKDYDKKIIIENNEEAIYEALNNVLRGKYEILRQKSTDYNYDNKYLIEQIKNVL